MRRRGLRDFWASTGVLVALTVAIVVAAAGLAYYSYEYAQKMAQRGEAEIVESTSDLAGQRRATIDTTIDLSDLFFYNSLADVRNLSDFPRRWAEFNRVFPNVQSVVVLDDRQQIQPDGFFSKRTKAAADTFRGLFERQIVKDLQLSTLQRDESRHLHKIYDGLPYLLSYTRRDISGRTCYLVLEADLTHLLLDVFPDVFQPDSRSRVYEIVDEDDRPVFGLQLLGVPERFVTELKFKNLSMWRLRMAPKGIPALLAHEEARRTTDWIFIGLSSFTLFVGLGILTYAVRAERRANQLKSEFIANVSHDLKTPLSLIRMYGELLATGRTKSGDTAREYAEIITRESERLSRLIDNVLDFARIERGHVVYDMKTVDVGDVVARGLDIFRHRLEREGMRLVVELGDGVPPVRADENALTLVLLNLIDNALKYAADGKEVRVTLEHEGDRVKLAVADRGPGIDPDERDRIFERFYRGRRDRSRPVRGSGIGLAIVKQITEAHGGEVTVDSAPGGSTFTISLPAARPADAAAPEEAAVS